jgi:hypothetical protein
LPQKTKYILQRVALAERVLREVGHDTCLPFDVGAAISPQLSEFLYETQGLVPPALTGTVPPTDPHVCYALLKHMWFGDFHEEALAGMQSFIKTFSEITPARPEHEAENTEDMHVLLSKAYLKYGDWLLQRVRLSVDLFLDQS